MVRGLVGVLLVILAVGVLGGNVTRVEAKKRELSPNNASLHNTSAVLGASSPNLNRTRNATRAGGSLGMDDPVAMHPVVLSGRGDYQSAWVSSFVWYTTLLAVVAISLIYRKRVETVLGIIRERTSTVVQPVIERARAMYARLPMVPRPGIPIPSLDYIKSRVATVPLLSRLPSPAGALAWLTSGGSGAGAGGMPGRKPSRTEPDGQVDLEMLATSFEYSPQFLNYKVTPILSKQAAASLVKHLPGVVRTDDWKLLYSSSEHGSLLNTLYERAIGRGPTVLVVRDESSSVFGAFFSQSWRRGMFGNGNFFVFSITPEIKVHRWSRKSSQFCNAQQSFLGIGGPKYAIHLDEKLRQGSSERCLTFDSPPLARSTDFIVYGVELWGFVVADQSILSHRCT